MIDTSENLIIIDGKIKTSQIEHCWQSQDTNKCNIVFKNNSQRYTYNNKKIIWLTKPVVFESNYCKIQYNERILSNIKTIVAFHHRQTVYWHIIFLNGFEKDYIGSEIKVTQSCLNNSRSKDVFKYLKLIAAENQLRDDNGSSMLSRQYNAIEFIPDGRSIAPYLNPKKSKCKKYTAPILIYPFGCNASQKRAIQAAFEAQISIIQGPPGTGKTQTILNIIANIVRLNKTVLVVSNNNSATENVLEKMEKCGIGFTAAMLGSYRNKQLFIKEDQFKKICQNDITSWHNIEADDSAFLEGIHEQSNLLSEIFVYQERLALARQELKAIKLERYHYKIESALTECSFNLRNYFNSTQLMNLMLSLQKMDNIKEYNSIFRNVIYKVKFYLIKLRCKMILSDFDNLLVSKSIDDVLSEMQLLYYQIKTKELEQEIDNIEEALKTQDATKITKQVTENSMTYLKNKLYHRYGRKHKKQLFKTINNSDTSLLLDEYPVILSTTFSSRNCIDPEIGFDYVIIDESSQVSAETGALALSCARNAIIVGDSMQLQNVITEEEKLKYEAILHQFNISDNYNCAKNSFLKSICGVLPNIPQTMLKEHYRCHPTIINFCNQKFYGGELIIMTQDNGEKDVMCAIKTVQGNHARGKMNQREIDVINNEILPKIPFTNKEIGIITPYNMQVDMLKDRVIRNVEIATVHKFQGREKGSIVMSMVDNIITPFSDDPNLLNVAISRAKKQFHLVISGNKQPNDSNISDLISYIKYNNGIITISNIRSIYDYLYSQYTEARIRNSNGQKRISEYDSENMTYALLEKIIRENLALKHLGIICHQPLNTLIQDFALLNERESGYAKNSATHIDFLIYNRVSKQAVLAIEVDGYKFHKSNTVQSVRDKLKNHILEQYQIPLLRLSTIDSEERTKIENNLKLALKVSNQTNEVSNTKSK